MWFLSISNSLKSPCWWCETCASVIADVASESVMYKRMKGRYRGQACETECCEKGPFARLDGTFGIHFLLTYVHFGLPRDQEGSRSSCDKDEDERIFLEIMFSRIFWWSWCASELDRNLAKEPLLYHKQIRKYAWKVTPKDSSIGWTVGICHRFFCVTSSNFLASIHIAT